MAHENDSTECCITLLGVSQGPLVGIEGAKPAHFQHTILRKRMLQAPKKPVFRLPCHLNRDPAPASTVKPPDNDASDEWPGTYATLCSSKTKG